MSDTESDQIYYGWKIVAALMILLTFSSGLSFYNHSIYLNALAAQPEFDVQSASLAISIFFLSSGIAGLWVAKWVQQHDPRICISAGAVISFLALSSLAYVETVWQLFLAYSFFGMGFSASSLIPATTLIARWFHKKRAMALSIASTGLSLGGVILTPLCVLLVESLSFKIAAPIMGVMYIVGIIPVAWIWLRSSPESMGIEVEGGKLTKVSSTGGNETAAAVVSRTNQVSHLAAEGITFREARSQRLFWGISVGFIFLMMAQVGGIAHQYGLVRELLSEAETAVVVAILPVASIVGRLLGGWVIGQMSIRLFAISMMILQFLSLILLATGFGVISLCLGLALFGTTVGNLLMLQPLLIAEAYGVRDYARIFSVTNLMSSWGTAAGPAVLGYVYISNQNQYSLSYAIAAAAGALGLLIFLTGGKLRQSN